MVMSTLFSADAHAAAYADPHAHADLVLDLAVKDAIAMIRDGRPGYAEFRLTRAAQTASRLIDGTLVWRLAWPGRFEDFKTEREALSKVALMTASVRREVAVYPVRLEVPAGVVRRD